MTKKTNSTGLSVLTKYSKYIMLGVSVYFMLATFVVSTYKFDNSLSLCACQPTTYQPTSFILKTLLYKERVYAINSIGCGGVNSCLPNSYIFPVDLLTIGVAFFVLFLIINEGYKNAQKKTKKDKVEHKIKAKKTTKTNGARTKAKPKKKTAVKKSTKGKKNTKAKK